MLDAFICFQLMFSYPSVSPVTALSGVISPTTFNNILSSSPVATPRTTPRSTPIPRWCTPIIIDENQDFAVMINMVTANSSDDILMQDGGCLGKPIRCLCSSHRYDLFLPRVRTTMVLTKSFPSIGPSLWNCLPTPLCSWSILSTALSLSLSLAFFLELKYTECASVWLMPWQVLYKYLYTIQYNI